MATPTADVLAITHLLKQERFYRDTGQWDLCRATFHPDASATYISVAWFEGTIDAFLHQSAQRHSGAVNIIHSSFDPVDIRVRANRATSDAFCLVTSSLTLHNTDYELACHMRLFTRLQRDPRTPHDWRILSLESAYVRDRLVTAFPTTSSSSGGGGGGVDPALLAVMNDEKIQAYPKAYRHLALVMSLRGMEPRRDLPHEGAPESVKRLGDRNRAFLNFEDDDDGSGTKGKELGTTTA